MPDHELADLLSTIIREELKPIDKRICTIENQVNTIEKRMNKLEKGQKQMQTEIRAMWADIKKLDKRRGVQEERAI